MGGGGGVRTHSFSGGSPMGGMGGMGGGGLPPGFPGMMFGGMPMGGMGGGGMPMGVPMGDMGGRGKGSSPKRPAPVEAPSRLDALRPNTPVTIFGLVNAAQHNGDTARVVEFDGGKDRYVVQLDGGETLSLKPANVQQMVSGVILVNIEGDASLNGKSGTLLKYDRDKDRYAVR